MDFPVLYLFSGRWPVVSGQLCGYNGPLLAAIEREGVHLSSQANIPSEQSEGKVSGGHFIQGNFIAFQF